MSDDALLALIFGIALLVWIIISVIMIINNYKSYDCSGGCSCAEETKDEKKDYSNTCGCG